MNYIIVSVLVLFFGIFSGLTLGFFSLDLAGLDRKVKMGNKDAKLWVKKNKKLIDEHNNKSKKSPSADYIEELKKLAELRDLGIITEEEFQQKKKELLGIK